MVYKELSPKAKIEYIWDYYKFPIVAVIFVSIMAVWIFLTVWENKHRVFALDLTIIGTQVDPNSALKLQEDLQALFVEKGIEGEITVDPIDLNDPDPNVQLAHNARFFSKTSTSTIDVLITFGDSYEEFLESGLYAPLDELFVSEDLNIDEDLKITGKLPEATEEKVYGINVTNNPKLAPLFNTDNGLILSIYVNSKKKDNAIEVLKYILE